MNCDIYLVKKRSLDQAKCNGDGNFVILIICIYLGTFFGDGTFVILVIYYCYTIDTLDYGRPVKSLYRPVNSLDRPVKFFR